MICVINLNTVFLIERSIQTVQTQTYQSLHFLLLWQACCDEDKTRDLKIVISHDATSLICNCCL